MGERCLTCSTRCFHVEIFMGAKPSHAGPIDLFSLSKGPLSTYNVTHQVVITGLSFLLPLP